MRNVLVSLAILLVCISGCKKDSDPLNPPSVIPFDLSLGKTWMYTWSFVLTDSTGKILNSETDTFQVRIASINDTLKNYKELIRFEARSIPHFIGVTKVWYQFAGDSLVEIAYNNAGSTPVVLPKRSTKTVREIWNGPPLFSLFPKSLLALMKSKGVQDTAIFREDIRIVYKFPLSIGKTWISFTYPFLQVREVVGAESIEHGGNNFSCAKIKTTLPEFAPDIEWYDYVSYEGLIEREIKVVLESTSTSDPEGTGEKELSTETLTLI